MNPLKELGAQGQSIWLDYIRRNLIRSGELKRMVDEDGIRGVTSNPTIFEKAIAGSTDYDEALRAMLARDGNADVEKLYEPLAIEDIQMAADVLRPVYDASNGDDGYVSLEVSPHLAHDTARYDHRSQAAARRGRPAQPDDQSTGDARRHSRHRAADRRRTEHQRDFDVFHEPL